MKKTEKSKLLKKKIDEILKNKNILDGELGEVTEDGVVFWFYMKNGKRKSIFMCHIDWHEDCWVEDFISEQEGPALLNCPIKFFGYKVDKNSMFPEWRYEVKKYHEEVGSIVQEQDIAIKLTNDLQKK